MESDPLKCPYLVASWPPKLRPAELCLTVTLLSLPGYKTITVRKFMQVREVKPQE